MITGKFTNLARSRGRKWNMGKYLSVLQIWKHVPNSYSEWMLIMIAFYCSLFLLWYILQVDCWRCHLVFNQFELQPQKFHITFVSSNHFVFMNFFLLRCMYSIRFSVVIGSSSEQETLVVHFGEKVLSYVSLSFCNAFNFQNWWGWLGIFGIKLSIFTSSQIDSWRVGWAKNEWQRKFIHSYWTKSRYFFHSHLLSFTFHWMISNWIHFQVATSFEYSLKFVSFFAWYFLIFQNYQTIFVTMLIP